MIHQLNLYGKDKVEIAIERIRGFEPEDGYWLAFSRGKDSCLIKALADLAGVKYEAHYSVTGIDPPELVHFIKKYHSDVIWDIPRDRGGNESQCGRSYRKRRCHRLVSSDTAAKS